VDGEDWEEVARLHNLNFPTNGRDLAKLKHKFQQIYQVERLTGDPLCPPKIRMAKRIREQIRDKTEINDGEGELLLQDPSFQDDNEGQLYEPVEDFFDGRDGGVDEQIENNNNINDENIAVRNANIGTINAPNQAKSSCY
jgi:hypothetical protein